MVDWNDETRGETLTFTHAGLANSELAFGHAYGETIDVYTGPAFEPSFMMLLRRRSPDGYQAVEYLPTSLLADLAHNFTGLDDLEGWERDTMFGDDLEDRVAEAIESQRIQIYRFQNVDRDRLTDPDDVLFAPPEPPDIEELLADGAADESPSTWRLALANELGAILVDRWRRKEAFDETFHRQNAAMQAVIKLGAAGEGGKELIVSGAEATWEITSTGFEVLGDGIEVLAREIVRDGTRERVVQAVRELGHDIADSADELQKRLREGWAIVEQLLRDPPTRRLLMDFFAGYTATVPETEWAKMAGSFAVEALIGIAVTVATGGAGAIAWAASAASRAGRFTKRAIDLLASLYRSLRRVGHSSKAANAAEETTEGISELAPLNKARRGSAGSDGPNPNRNKTDRDAANDDTNDTPRDNDSGETENGQKCASASDSTLKGCPVDMVTGEELLQLVDFEVPGWVPLVWQRVYRSGRNSDRGLGAGWSYPGSERLVLSGEKAFYEDVEGRSIPLPLPGRYGVSENVREGITLREQTNGYRVDVSGEPIRYFTYVAGANGYPLTGLRDQYGRGWSFQHSGSRLQRIVNDNGRQLELSHDAQGRITAIHDSGTDGERRLPPLARYQYSDQGDLIQASDAAGGTEHFRYRNHLLVQRTLKSGFSYHFEWDRYDIHARCLRQTGDDGIYDYRFRWDPASRRNQSIDSYDRVETFDHDEAGRITREVAPDGAETHYRYDANGQLAERIEPNGARWRFHLDDRGRLLSRTDPTGATYYLSYDHADRVTAITDPLGHQWQRRFDAQGRLIATVDPDNNVTRFRYDDQHRLTRIMPALGREHHLEWDDRDRLIRETDPMGRSTRYHYDAYDRITQVTRADGAETHYAYDPMGRITGVTRPDGARIELDYDKAGRLTRFRDGLGRETHYAYGGLSQVEARIDPAGQRLRYEYDRERNLTGLVNENGERYTLRYDACDRLVEEIGFDGRHQRFSYNQAGHLVQHIDEDVTTEFERDALGRLTAKTASDGSYARFRYDAMGRLTRADNAARFVGFDYDNLGRLVTEEQDQHRLRHRYDALGRRIASVGPAGEINIGYGADGTLRAVSHEGQPLAQFRYDDLGREIGRRQGAVEATFDYDPAGRLASQRGRTKDGDREIIRRDYRYDAAGRLASLIDQHQGATHYHYDALDRLTRAEGLIDEPFDFDPAGNLLGDAHGEAGVGAGNRLTFHGDRHFDYDRRGNLVEERRGTGGRRVTHYEYDAANQLIAVDKEGQRSTYAYDALGRRVAKTTPAGTTEFIWDGDTLHGEHAPEGNRYYVYEPGSFRPLALIEPGATYYYHLDHLGTPRELTDQEGHIVWQAAYRAYGETIHADGHVSQPLRFQGQYFDAETGLHYNRFRYYDPQSGRFVHQDPVGLLGGLNLYRSAPNPIGWTDVFGLSCNEGDKEFEGRSAAFRQAKRDAGIPVSKQPDYVKRTEMTGLNQKSDGPPISTREYKYTNRNGEDVWIQDHSAGHEFNDNGAPNAPATKPHFNVRPQEKDGVPARTETFAGTADHYYWSN